MNATGKKMRKAKGMNRHELHHADHAHKRHGKIFRVTAKSEKKG